MKSQYELSGEHVEGVYNPLREICRPRGRTSLQDRYGICEIGEKRRDWGGEGGGGWLEGGVFRVYV